MHHLAYGSSPDLMTGLRVFVLFFTRQPFHAISLCTARARKLRLSATLSNDVQVAVSAEVCCRVGCGVCWPNKSGWLAAKCLSD